MPIVAACCISHAPQILLEKPSNGSDYLTYVEVARSLHEDIAAARPDVILLVTNDHFDNFFLNNIPAIAIGVGEEPYRFDAGGWGRPGIAYEFAAGVGLAVNLLEGLLDRGVDVAALHKVTMGMDVLVPLYFLRPEADIPLVPVYINDYVDPRPRPRRVYEWGEKLADILRNRPERVAIIGTGGAIALGRDSG